jgi:tetratricopeptide (TPR) repeat protein
MKSSFTIFIFILSFTVSFAQDVNLLIKEANRLEDIPNEVAALNKFKEAIKLDPTHIYSLAKSSELCSRIGSREVSSDKRDAWYAAARAYANKALAIDPLNDQANVAMAMVSGKISLTKNGKEKIINAKEIKKLVDVALKTNPNNYLAWHILGRWNYEISNVSMIERAAAKVFFGGIPEGSLKNAIMYFEKTKTLMPYFILNYIELAKAYQRDGQSEKAITLLKTIQSFPINTEDDLKLKADALEMIKGWQ